MYINGFGIALLVNTLAFMQLNTSNVLLLQAFSYGKEALDLRKKVLKKKFKLNSGVSASTKRQHCGQDLISVEAWGPAIAEIWPDRSRSTTAKDSFLTPWNALRCYLESTLQVR